MKKSIRRLSFVLILILMLSVLLLGCSPIEKENPSPDKREAIPFLDNQLYAVAYLGYGEMDDLSGYMQYLDSENIPVHYMSTGEYYLIIPRYTGMHIALYENDMETGKQTLRYEDADCRPFILQCNVSDIFSDAQVRLTANGETVEFSPFISLKDGSVSVGDRGINITISNETAS